MRAENYEVVTEYRASFPYSVELKAGERVTITEKEEEGWVWCICKDERGVWVPNSYPARKLSMGTMLLDYCSAKLNVKVGEKLSCNKEASGWLWCINQKAERGWVPVAKLRKLNQHKKRTK